MTIQLRKLQNPKYLKAISHLSHKQRKNIPTWGHSRVSYTIGITELDSVFPRFLLRSSDHKTRMCRVPRSWLTWSRSLASRRAAEWACRLETQESWFAHLQWNGLGHGSSPKSLSMGSSSPSILLPSVQPPFPFTEIPYGFPRKVLHCRIATWIQVEENLLGKINMEDYS